MKLYSTSRIGRRLGERFFFKAERDTTQKSAMMRRPYPPGMHGKRSRRTSSEFAMELKEKQKLRYRFGLSDTALRRCVLAAGRVTGMTRHEALVSLLERRFDNVAYRLGLAPSRRIARQLISHGHLTVNDRPARIPSRLIKTGDRIAIRSQSRTKAVFGNVAIRLKKHQPPPWLTLDAEAGTGRVTRQPSGNDLAELEGVGKAIEYYSR